MSAALDQAIVFHRQGRLDHAEQHYQQALSEDFDDPNALYLYGTVCLQTNRLGLAATLLRRAIDVKPDHFEAWNNLGSCHKSMNREEQAQACFRQAALIPGKTPTDYADIQNNLATLYINSGEPERGEPFAREALKLCPEHADAAWNLSLLLLEQSQYAEGFPLYEFGTATKNRQNRTYGREIPIWDGAPGKHVIVWGEQGIGDEIMFASILPEMIERSASVVLECHPRLVDLFKASFPKLAGVYGTRKDQYINWPQKHPQINARVAIGSLPMHFRKSYADFEAHARPYLSADRARVAHYRAKLARLGPGPYIGISWEGGTHKTRNDYRSIPLTQWGDVLSERGTFVSLQYTPDAHKAVCDVEEQLNVRVHHWPSAVQAQNYDETAALVCALDGIVSVNTSIVHLAGALGTPTLTLTPKAHAWRYSTPPEANDRMVWYSNVQILRAPETGDWAEPMRQAADWVGEVEAALLTA